MTVLNCTQFAVEPQGRMDLNNTVQRVTFVPSGSDMIVDVTINFLDDAINEANEGLLVVVRVDEAASDPQDVQNLALEREGVASVTIINDDRECIIYFTYYSTAIQQMGVNCHVCLYILYVLRKRESQLYGKYHSSVGCFRTSACSTCANILANRTMFSTQYIRLFYSSPTQRSC